VTKKSTIKLVYASCALYIFWKHTIALYEEQAYIQYFIVFLIKQVQAQPYWAELLNSSVFRYVSQLWDEEQMAWENLVFSGDRQHLSPKNFHCKQNNIVIVQKSLLLSSMDQSYGVGSTCRWVGIFHCEMFTLTHTHTSISSSLVKGILHFFWK